MKERLDVTPDLYSLTEEQLAERVQLLTSVVDEAYAELEKIETEYRKRLEGFDAPLEVVA